MNVVLQRHGARHIYAVPEGLKELMMDISREVLRSQPEQIYLFIADYCDALMITRENARIAAGVVDNLTDCSITIVELLRRTGMTIEEADENARIIQRFFRSYMERKQYPKQYDKGAEEHLIEEILRELKLPKFRAEKASKVIKHAWRSFKERQQIFQDDMEFVNWRTALRNAMFLYRRTGIPEETARRAASTIKAAYRGYYTRHYLKGIKNNHEIGEQVATHGVGNYPPNVQCTFDKLKLDPKTKEAQDAIIKIQHTVRRFIARHRSKRIAHEIMHTLTKNPEPCEECDPQRKKKLRQMKKPIEEQTESKTGTKTTKTRTESKISDQPITTYGGLSAPIDEIDDESTGRNLITPLTDDFTPLTSIQTFTEFESSVDIFSPSLLGVEKNDF